jgi:hypothetical protein
MHRITLNTNVQSMFFLPNKFHLTWENPGPVDIDVNELSETERNWLRNAKLKNVLKIENLNPEIPIETKKTAASVQAIKEEDSDKIKQDAETKRLKRIEDATKTLNAPIPALTRFIEKCGDPLQLRTMKELELQGKKRSKVQKLLEDRLSALQVSVGSIVGPALQEDAIFKEAKLPDIEEELEDAVTIKLGSE